MSDLEFIGFLVVKKYWTFGSSKKNVCKWRTSKLLNYTELFRAGAEMLGEKHSTTSCI